MTPEPPKGRPLHRHPLAPVAAALLLLLPACGTWLFAGYTRVDRSRPVALVETTGGVEFGATTEFGILTLGRTAKDGPCRVHYFLGPTPLIEDGRLAATDSAFCRAEIDLKTQHLRVLDRTPGPDDALVAMWTPDGLHATTVDVALARANGVEGDVLADPGTPLPPGASLFARHGDDLLFVGLVSGRATVDSSGDVATYYTFAGVDRLRELLAIPELHPTNSTTHFRADDIAVRKPAR